MYLKDNSIPKVYIVIINYNGTEDTVECIESLKQLDYTNFKIVLIDNASRESCIPSLANTHQDLIAIESKVNLGFAGGCNVGMQKALEDGADYIWLLNNDTAVDKAALKQMVLAIHDKPQYGIACSKVLKYGTNDVDSCGGQIFPLFKYSGKTIKIGMGQADNEKFNSNYDVEYAPGASMLIKKEVIDKIGVLDERFFAYYEETDFCVRARAQNYKILYVCDSIVHHKWSRSFGGNSPLKTYYFARNSLLMLNKNYRNIWYMAIYWWPKSFVFNFLIRREWKHMMVAMRALSDFFRGRFGGKTF